MSQNKYASPLQLKLKPSATLSLIVVAIHLGALLMVAVIDIPWIIRLLLTMIVLIHLLLSLDVHRQVPAFKALGNLRPKIHCIVWDHGDRWILLTEDGGEYQALLLRRSFVHPRLTTVNLKLAGQPWYCRYRSFVFMPDNLDSETFRRLRVRLRWYSMPEQDSLEALK